MPALGHTIATRPIVTINAKPRPDIAFVRAERSTGGKKLDTAILEYRVRSDNRRDDRHVERKIVGRLLQAETREPQVVRVQQGSPYGGNAAQALLGALTGISPLRTIHVGVISRVTVRYGPEGPVYELESVLKPDHFGIPINGYPSPIGRGTDTTNNAGLESPGDGQLPAVPPLFRPDFRVPSGEATAGALVIAQDMVFNPVVDGQIVGNRLPLTLVPGESHDLFIDPEQSRAPGNLAAHRVPGNRDRLRWTLLQALKFIMTWLNSPPQLSGLVANPELFDTSRDPLGRPLGAIKLENLVLKIGWHLPECLDALLLPYGFDWYTDIQPAKPTIRIYQRGVGEPLDVYHQRPGTRLTPAANNATGFHIGYDTAETVNHFQIVGAPRRFELTAPLIPAWDLVDELAIDWSVDWHTKLTKGAPLWLTEPKWSKVLRQWVVNEGGSCIGHAVRNPIFVQEEFAYTITSAFDLAGYLGVSRAVCGVRNRRFFPTITAKPDLTPVGPHGGLLIEWSPNSGTNWYPIDQWGNFGSVTVLDDEMGIRFDDELPPPAVMQYRDAIRFRVTASIDMDDCLAFDGGRRQPSVAGDNQMRVIDGSDRFFHRIVTKRSLYYKDVHHDDPAKRLRTTEINDLDRMVATWQQLMSAWNQADCDGAIPLPTLACPAELGMVVPQVNGVNVGLATTLSGGAGTALEVTGAPSVVGIGYDQQGQESVIFLNSHKGKLSL